MSRVRTYETWGRGRPRFRSKTYTAPLKSILLIAKKYDLNPNQLIDAIIQAVKNKNYSHGSLKISPRRITKESISFLITKDDKVISQFPINREILKNPEYLKECIRKIPISRYKTSKISKTPKKIADLRYGMKRINIQAQVIEIPSAKLVVTRFGNHSYVSNITISDETGTIRLSLWNNQINQVRVDDGIEIKSCYVANFAGELQLRLGRKGTITVLN